MSTLWTQGDTHCMGMMLVFHAVDAVFAHQVNELVDRGTKDVNEFEWQMQLRYAFENEEVIVRQVREFVCAHVRVLTQQGHLLEPGACGATCGVK